MEDIRVFNIPLPFNGKNYMARALEFEKVKFHCQDYPVRFLPGGGEQKLEKKFNCIVSLICLFDIFLHIIFNIS